MYAGSRRKNTNLQYPAGGDLCRSLPPFAFRGSHHPLQRQPTAAMMSVLEGGIVAFLFSFLHVLGVFLHWGSANKWHDNNHFRELHSRTCFGGT